MRAAHDILVPPFVSWEADAAPAEWRNSRTISGVHAPRPGGLMCIRDGQHGNTPLEDSGDEGGRPYVDCPASSPSPVYLRGHGYPHRHPGRDGHRHHARGHFPVHRHSHRECPVGVHGPVAGGDGEARRYELRAQPHFERKRHRAHRIAGLQRLSRWSGFTSIRTSRSTWPWRR